MSFYQAFDLIIESDIRLPELPAYSDPWRRTDIRIRMADAHLPALEGGVFFGPSLCVKDGLIWIEISGVGRFLICGGSEIILDPSPGVDECRIRPFLLGSAFGALFFQRGLLVLHGNAICIDDHCLICVGESGAGKSTLAARFAARGYDVIADDVVPVDANCRALPSFPRIKLWQDAARFLDIDTGPLPSVYPGLDKYSVPLRDRWRDQPTPVRWIVLLDKDRTSDVHIAPVSGAERFKLLLDNTYRHFFLTNASLRSSHLHSCQKLSNVTTIARLTRSNAISSIDSIVDKLLKFARTDLEKN